MALNSQLSAQNLTDIRAGGYHAMQYVCVVPNEVQVQFLVGSVPSADVFAEIEVGAIQSGSMSDVREAMTVIISTSTDYQATELFRLRVRTVSGTSTLYVNENSYQLSTSYYVTVLNAYELHEKLRRYDADVGVEYADWNIAVRNLLPIETALPSAVIIAQGGTSYSPTAVGKAMANGASISGYSWESSNGNDSFSSTSVANPTITLQANSFRQLRCTITDSNGNSSFRVIACWTVPKNYANVVKLGFVGSDGAVADISHDIDSGPTCTVPAISGISDILHNTFCVVASDEWINGSFQNIRSNINFCGFLQNERTTTRGDERYGVISEARFEIRGMGALLSALPVSKIPITQASGVSSWGDMVNPTPGRNITYLLTEHTTALHLCSLAIPSDDTDFIGDDIDITADNALDGIRFVNSTINAVLQFNTNGCMQIVRDLNNRNDTARNAATTVCQFTLADVESFEPQYEAQETVGMVTMVGGVYNTTLDTYTLFEASAPAIARGRGAGSEDIVNQVLETDSTQANALAELEQRVANALARLNPTYEVTVDLFDEWHFLLPDLDTWFTFDIAATDTVRGKVFTSADRWNLISISNTSNIENGRKRVRATFRLETKSTGAKARTAPIQDSQNYEDYKPAIAPSFDGGNSPDDWFDSFDPTPPSSGTPPKVGCEQNGIRIRSAPDVDTTRSALNGERILTVVKGSGILVESTGASDTLSQDFTVGQGTWGNVGTTPVIDANSQPNSGNAGSYSAGVGFVTSDYTEGDGLDKTRGVIIYNEFDAITVTQVSVAYDYTKGHFENPAKFAFRLYYKDGGGTWQVGATILASVINNGSLNTSWVPAEATIVTGIAVTVRSDVFETGSRSGSATITNINVYEADTTRGDAFYESVGGGPWTAYDSGYGLYIDNVQPTGIPPYNPEHEYAVYTTSAGGVVQYDFTSPYPTSDAENWSLLIGTCFLGIP